MERPTQSVGYRLAKILRSRIAHAEYKSEFPTENDLIREFGMSRYAVRSALNRLAAEGLIERHAGRGTTVLKPSEVGSPWVIRTVEDLIGRNLTQTASLVSSAPVKTSRFPDVARMFGLGIDTRLFLVERLVAADDGRPSLFSMSFMPLEVGLALSRRDLGRGAIVLAIERTRRIKAQRVRQVATSGAAPERTAKLLGIAPRSTVLILRRTYFDADGEPIVHGELHHRLEDFEQTIDFFRGEH